MRYFTVFLLILSSKFSLDFIYLKKGFIEKMRRGRELRLVVFVHHLIEAGTKVSVFAQGSMPNRMPCRHHGFFLMPLRFLNNFKFHQKFPYLQNHV